MISEAEKKRRVQLYDRWVEPIFKERNIRVHYYTELPINTYIAHILCGPGFRFSQEQAASWTMINRTWSATSGQDVWRLCQ